MAELFDRGKRQRELEDGAQEQRRRNLFVLAFFFIVLVGAVILLSHWRAPGGGWQIWTGIVAGSCFAIWLFDKFQKRG